MAHGNENVEVILVVGVFPSQPTCGGRQTHNSLLFYAAMYGHVDIVRMLVENGALVEAKNHDALTALMCAALHGHADVVSALLAAGASVSAQDSFGRTALMFAAMANSPACVTALLAHKASRSIHDEVCSGGVGFAVANAVFEVRVRGEVW